MSTYKAPSCSVENPYTPAPRAADPGAPDPEELMSRDQIEALQFERLRWTLHYAYENRAYTPVTSKSSTTSSSSPTPTKNSCGRPTPSRPLPCP